MPNIDVTVDCPVYDSFRVQQVAGMFDVPIAERASERFRVEMPDLGSDLVPEPFYLLLETLIRLEGILVQFYKKQDHGRKSDD